MTEPWPDVSRDTTNGDGAQLITECRLFSSSSSTPKCGRAKRVSLFSGAGKRGGVGSTSLRKRRRLFLKPGRAQCHGNPPGPIYWIRLMKCVPGFQRDS